MAGQLKRELTTKGKERKRKRKEMKWEMKRGGERENCNGVGCLGGGTGPGAGSDEIAEERSNDRTGTAHCEARQTKKDEETANQCCRFREIRISRRRRDPTLFVRLRRDDLQSARGEVGGGGGGGGGWAGGKARGRG